MPRSTSSRSARTRDNNATLGFEAKLWQAADALRNNMDAAEYKHVVLGLIFLKYISDAFEAKHDELDAQRSEGADPEDPDEYRAENIFWVPPEARWSYLKGAAPQPTIGQIVDDAMAAIERDNSSLKSVLPKDYEPFQMLGTLDDKIELNRRMNGTLEAMARALFKSWFIDFDPVRAKAEGRDPGLPTRIANLFPARLVDSELGEIPEGWVVGTFGDVAQQMRRAVYRTRTYAEAVHCVV
jgi:type I restriction enzyme M protein